MLFLISSRSFSLTTPGGAPTSIALAQRRRPRMWLSRRNAYSESVKVSNGTMSRWRRNSNESRKRWTKAGREEKKIQNKTWRIHLKDWDLEKSRKQGMRGSWVLSLMELVTECNESIRSSAEKGNRSFVQQVSSAMVCSFFFTFYCTKFLSPFFKYLLNIFVFLLIAIRILPFILNWYWGITALSFNWLATLTCGIKIHTWQLKFTRFCMYISYDCIEYLLDKNRVLTPGLFR